MIRTLAAACTLACTCLAAHAETTLYFREGQRVDPQEVKRILQNTGTAARRTRSIRMLADAPADVDFTNLPAGAEVPASLSLPVQFEFDSASISASAREQLDALAEGIKLLPPERKVVVEGHTDASGSDEYNLSLSLRRAQAVKQYLVREHGIAAARLQDTGVGKRQPAFEGDPYAAENRRVQFRGR